MKLTTALRPSSYRLALLSVLLVTSCFTPEPGVSPVETVVEAVRPVVEPLVAVGQSGVLGVYGELAAGVLALLLAGLGAKKVAGKKKAVVTEDAGG
jgi:hypothetical protein